MKIPNQDFSNFQPITTTLSANFKQKMLHFAVQYEACTYLTNNDIPYPHEPFEELIAIGIKKEVQMGKDSFRAIQEFHEQHQSWLFGFLTYDLKNELEELESNNIDPIGFPKAGFYIPQHIIRFYQDEVSVLSEQPVNELIKEIEAVSIDTSPLIQSRDLKAKRVRKKHYLDQIETIKNHILEGTTYELNYCIEHYLEACALQPVEVFRALNAASPMPFAAFQKYQSHYAMCASPERFMKKSGNQLICQPIKGTIKRGQDAKHDERLKQELYNSDKERAENMMIVDLVRNDLARSCKIGSVKVAEMFGIYTFATLHQMISTVTAELRPEESFINAIKYAFPMGSMTGAPKIISMKLIEELESCKRGLFSGSIGYITPSGDFDFNVVIRSILYNEAKKVALYMVGGAITIDSIPESEWHEAFLKSMGMRGILGF